MLGKEEKTEKIQSTASRQNKIILRSLDYFLMSSCLLTMREIKIRSTKNSHLSPIKTGKIAIPDK